MPHIHTEPGQYDETSSAYIVRTDFEEPKIMLHLHKILGVYMQFGGHKELVQNPWEAVIDEVLKESGYEMSQLLLLQPKDSVRNLGGSGKTHPHSVYQYSHDFEGLEKHKHTDTAWAFTADEEPKSSVAVNESGEIRLFTRDEIADLPADMTNESVRNAALYVLDVCLYKWDRVAPEEFN